MNRSKWNYIAVGFSGALAIFSALIHDGLFLIINLFFAVFNWYVAEHKRKLEETELIAEYEKAKEAENKN